LNRKSEFYINQLKCKIFCFINFIVNIAKITTIAAQWGLGWHFSHTEKAETLVDLNHAKNWVWFKLKIAIKCQDYFLDIPRISKISNLHLLGMPEKVSNALNNVTLQFCVTKFEFLLCLVIIISVCHSKGGVAILLLENPLVDGHEFRSGIVGCDGCGLKLREFRSTYE